MNNLPRWAELIAQELDTREEEELRVHGKSDDPHYAFAYWLLAQFDEAMNSER